MDVVELWEKSVKERISNKYKTFITKSDIARTVDRLSGKIHEVTEALAEVDAFLTKRQKDDNVVYDPIEKVELLIDLHDAARILISSYIEEHTKRQKQSNNIHADDNITLYVKITEQNAHHVLSRVQQSRANFYQEYLVKLESSKAINKAAIAADKATITAGIAAKISMGGVALAIISIILMFIFEHHIPTTERVVYVTPMQFYKGNS